MNTSLCKTRPSSATAIEENLFVDDTSLFPRCSKYKFNRKRSEQWFNESKGLGYWMVKWFSPDPKKQALEVIFSRKVCKIDKPALYFNENLLKSSSTHKHLGVILHTKLDFGLCLQNSVQNKVNRTLGLLCKLLHKLFYLEHL